MQVVFNRWLSLLTERVDRDAAACEGKVTKPGLHLGELSTTRAHLRYAVES